MDVRIGVLAHTILQYKTREKFTNRKDNKLDIDEFEDFAAT